MSQWRRLPFILMALFALCALTVPSFAWACPVTGRSGTVSQVCAVASAAAQSSQDMSCCSSASSVQTNNANCLGTCCKPVPQLPGSDSSKNTTPSQASASISGLLAQLSQSAHAVFILASPVAPLSIEPPQIALWDDASVAPLLTQYAFSLFAGRGPPVG